LVDVLTPEQLAHRCIVIAWVGRAVENPAFPPTISRE
jgi:hypothetical protein